MDRALACPGERARGRPRVELADIVRAHGESFRRRFPVSSTELRVLGAIVRCRTPELGGHLDVCAACGHEAPSYNSCRDRHCPKCQLTAQARWVHARMARVLPTHYFHVVFTLPQELRPLARRFPSVVFDRLFAAASDTLLELGRDPVRLGGELGATLVLHTWARDLAFHPHVHAIVTGGGLRPDGARWVAARRDYLFPGRVLAALFRGKLLAALRRAHRDGRLGRAGPHDDPRGFDDLLDRLYRKTWVVYAKRPFGGPEQVLRYLGRYTHRVGISNHRLVSLAQGRVTFRTKAGKTLTLEAEEFLRRFTQHVLPPRFVKIRHVGLMAPRNVGTKLEAARRRLTSPPLPPDLAQPCHAPAAPALPTSSAMASARPCPLCRTGALVRCALPDARAPPGVAA